VGLLPSAARASRAASTGRAGLAAATAAAAVHLLPGVVSWRSARCRLLPRLSGVGRDGHVALTFDDGPDPRSTPAILDALDELGWRATFFCLGHQVDDAPGLVSELVGRGHELGVHGNTHRNHLRRSGRSVVADVRRARDRLEDLSGRQIRWFRPPYGAVSASSLLAARVTGLQIVLWSSWGLDWEQGATPASVTENVMRTFGPGATVLLHDSDLTSAPLSWMATAGALPLLAERWRELSLDVGPLGEHF
jgi:peptidoglycan/xylan/chitin deacetylase (PgdA/CDA1 family)